MNIILLHVTPFMDVRVKKAFFERDVFTQIFTLVNGVYFVWPFFAFSKDLLYISNRCFALISGEVYWCMDEVLRT